MFSQYQSKKINSDYFFKLAFVLIIFFVFTLLISPASDKLLAAEVMDELPYNNSQIMDVDGISLHYRLWKPVEPQIKGQILLVHGLGGSTFSWHQQVAQLQEAGYLVVAVDLPAFGYSDRQSGLEHTPKNRASWLWELLSTLAANEEQIIKSSWHLTGHSMGSGVVTAMAAQKPEKTASLTLVAAALEQSDARGSDWLAFAPLRRGFHFVINNILFRESIIKRALTSAYGREPTSEELTAYFEPLRLSGTAAAWLDVTETADNLSQAEIRNINLPVLLIWGEEDTWVELESGKEYAEIFPESRLKTISGAYHMPMETHPEKFNRIFLNWLKEQNLKE